MEISFEKLPHAVSEINQRLQNIERLLSERAKDVQPDSKDLLTIEEAAKLLDVSVPTVYGYVHERLIPFSKVRKRLYFSKREITEWINTGRKKTVAEINASAASSLVRKERKK
jgi:excisionase family DNA binding protein